MLLKRLFTHEDGAFGHAHKILGVSVLASFAFRAWTWATSDSMGFDAAPWTVPACVLLHAALHASSFQFVVGARRNRRYNVIWPEMRWHSAIFAGRSLATMLCIWATPNPRTWVRAAIVAATMALADLVTARYKAADVATASATASATTTTTMRDNPYPEGTPAWVIRPLNAFYSVSQAGATLVVLTSSSIDTVFWLLFPIQTAPFLMTLVKKGAIGQAGWHLAYAAAVASSYMLSMLTPMRMSVLSWGETLAVLAAFAAWRMLLRGDKYVFWAAVAAYAHVRV